MYGVETEIVNSEERDPILDVFLEEVFADAAPPDLSDRIVDEWAARDQHKQVDSPNEVSQDLPPEEPAAPPRTVKPPTTPVTEPVSINASSTGENSGWARLAIGMALTLVTVAAIVVATQNGNQIANQDPRHNSGDSTEQPNDGERLANAGSERGADSKGANQNGAQTPTTSNGEGLAATSASGDKSKDKKPSAFDEPAPFERVAKNKPAQSTERERVDVEPLDDAKVLAELNLQLNNLWQVNSVQPAARATDAEYCRRVFVALIGRIPTVSELEAFLAREESPGGEDKRAWLVNRLQNHPAYRPTYVANWTNFWTNVLIGRTGGQRPDGLANREGLAIYLSKSLLKRQPYDEMVAELITAEGVNEPGQQGFNGAVNFLLDGYSRDSALATARTARVFHGKQIQCVQCHNHPTNETWTQNNFWEFNAFFRQMKANKPKGGGPVRLVDEDFRGESGGSVDEAEIYFERLDGVKRVAYPVFFDGRAISKRGDVASVNRRQELAQLVIDSPDLSRAAVNRLWTRVFHYGLTNPVDDMGDHNPPDHPQMLELLAKQFSANKYDLDQLIQWMVTSDAFQLSSRAPSEDYADKPETGKPPLFSRYYTRQLSPEAVYDSLLLAANEQKSGSSAIVGGEYIRAQRAWLGQFSKDMNTDEGQETNTFAGDIRQSVIVMTSPVMKRAVSNELGGVLQQVTQSNMSLTEKIDHLFLAALSRKPTPKELKAVRNLIEARSSGGRTRNDAAGLQDIWWALLNSNEFILNH